MKNIKLIIAPGVLKALNSEVVVSELQLNIKLLSRLLNLSKTIPLNNKINCIEQLTPSLLQNKGSIAVLAATKAQVYKQGFDYLLVDFTKLLIELDHVRMGQIVAPKREKLITIIAELNNWYKDENWQFILADNGQVFLESKQGFDIVSYPTRFVINKSMQHFLPQATQKNYWLKIINEMQMILFQNNFEAQNIWFWGEQTVTLGTQLKQGFDDVLILTDAEDALLAQDSEKWIEAVNTLNEHITEFKKQYQQISLVLDYENIYHYQNSFTNKIRGLFNCKSINSWLVKSEES